MERGARARKRSRNEDGPLTKGSKREPEDKKDDLREEKKRRPMNMAEERWEKFSVDP